MKRITIFLGAVALFLTPLVLADVPGLVNLQGRLRDGSGNLVSDGTYSVVFAIYGAALGGSPVWAETTLVTTSGGVFTVLLGSVNPVPDSVFDNPARYLGIKVNTDPEMIPRQRLTSVGYSQRSSEWTSTAGDLYRLNGDVGIGTTSPTARLQVDDPNFSIVANVVNNYAGEIIAVQGVASGNFGEKTALSGTVTGGVGFGFGVNAHCNTSGVNYAVYGSASGGTENWAGYFPNGNVYVGEQVGIGTTSPTAKLQVDDPNFAIVANVDNNNAGEIIAVQGVVSGNFGEKTALSGTVTGGVGFGFGVNAHCNTSGVNYAVYGSASGGTENWAGYFPSGNMYVGERVGIGTPTPGSKLHVAGAGYPNAFGFFDTYAAGQDAGLRFLENGIVKSHLYHQASTNTLNLFGEGFSGLSVTSIGRVGIGTAAPAALLHVNGTAGNNTGVWSTLSDRRLKKDIEPLRNGLETVTQLKPVTFRWKDDEKDAQFGRVRGLIAQDVEDVIPEWVKTDPDGYKRIEPIGVDALLIEAIKELKITVTNQADQIAAQSARIEELSAMVAKLVATDREQEQGKKFGQVR